MTFEEDLIKRRIDVVAFAAGDPEKFAAWKTLYQQVHPNSFYAMVKMVINDVRRRFWLQEAPKPAAAPATTLPKPVVSRVSTIPGTASAIPDEPSPTVDRTPEPAPPAAKGRAVIRRPGVTTPPAPAEKAPSTDNTVPAPASETPAPAPSAPGRARPVFRRPAAEPSPDAPAQTPGESGNQPPEKNNAESETSKPARPRPVFRKPAAPAESNAAELAPDASKAATSPELPEHSNPNPEEEAPKPARPRPVFKRPTPPATPEALPGGVQEPDRPADPGSISNTETATQAGKAPTFPRPRPVIKRPATPALETTSEPVIENTGTVLENAPAHGEPNVEAQEQAITVRTGNEKAMPEPNTTADALASKPPRPRPVFKRPARPEPPADETSTDTP